MYIRKNVKRLKNNLPALTKDFNPVEHVNLYNYKAVMRTVKKYGFDFVSSDNVLCLTDFYKMRKSMGAIKFFNWIEWLSTKVIV